MTFQSAPIEDGYQAFGSLFQLASGTLGIICRKGTSHFHSGDYASVVSHYSSDNGDSWSAAGTIRTEAGIDSSTSCSAGTVADDRIISFHTRFDPDTPATWKSINYQYSDNGGGTFSVQGTLNCGADFIANTSAAQAHGTPTVIGGGTVIQMWYGGTAGWSDWNAYASFSGDNGQTWGTRATVIEHDTLTYTEAGIAYLGGSTILGLIRKEAPGTVYQQVKSTDNGITWTDQGETSFDSWTNPSPASLIAYEGRTKVACYYAHRNDLVLRRVTADADDLIATGPTAWSEPEDLVALANVDSGYQGVIHPYDTDEGWGFFYDWYGRLRFFVTTQPALLSRLVVREKPPLRQNVTLETPGGQIYRWGEDERDPEKAFRDLSYGSGMPGGSDQMSATLPRKSNVEYFDLEPFSNIQVRDAAGEVTGEYRLDSAPKTSGDEFSVSPNAVGWQAHLEDTKNCAVVFIDRAFDHWQGMSVQRQSELATGGYEIRGDGEVSPDKTTGNPSLRLLNNQSGTTVVNYIYESWYDGGAADLETIYYEMGPTENISNMDYVNLGIWNRDDGGTGEISSDLAAGGSPFSDSGYFTPTMGTIDPRWASVAYSGAVADWTAGEDRVVPWTQLQVMGGHGLTLRGTADPTAQGFYASDVVQHVIDTWCPELSVGTIDDTTFVIPQLEFRTPTTPAEMIKQANRFHLFDWFIGPGKKFHYRQRGTYGQNWLARVGPAKLDSTGQTVSRCVTDVLISYQDTDGGVTKTVGPVGSGADTEDASLHDSDTQNPANVAGIAVWATLDMGQVSTPAAATQVGARFLEEVNQIDHSGRAELTGWVMSDKGVTYPFSSVQAGDTITFLDAADTSPRRIVKATKAENTVSVDLDAPPEGVQALLERLGVQWTNLAAVGAPVLSYDAPPGPYGGHWDEGIYVFNEPGG